MRAMTTTSLLLWSTRSVSRSTSSSVSIFLRAIRGRPADRPDLCGFDVMQAVKQMPDVAAGLAAALFTVLGMVAALFGLIGSSKPVVSSAQVHCLVQD